MGLVSVDVVTRLAARDGGQLTELPSVDLLLLTPIDEHWNFYLGGGLGLFNARARGGMHIHPMGRSRSGVLLLGGVRALAGFLLTDSPASDAPPTNPQTQSVTWSYTAILGEAGIGWRVARASKNSDIYVIPTFLGGPVHYATGGRPTSARVWNGTAPYYGGTVSLAFEWD
jgi:hypothetical protein